MPITSYLNEIKNRFNLIALSCTVLIFTSFLKKEILLFIYIKQFINIKEITAYYFITTNATEMFYSYLDTILQTNIVFFTFFALFHLSIFIRPGLYFSEKELLTIFKKLSISISLLSCYVLYKKLFPQFWGIFCFNLTNLTELKYTIFFEPKLSEYISLLVNTLNLNLVISQIFTFFILYLRSLNKPVNLIKKKRKNLIYTIFVITAVITPPDIFCQIYLWIPGGFLIEISIIYNLFYSLCLIRQPIKTNQ